MKTLAFGSVLVALCAAAQVPSASAPPLVPAGEPAAAAMVVAPAEALAPTEPPPRFSGWHAAGVWGGASFGASLGSLVYGLTSAALPHSRTGNCPGAGCAVAAFSGIGVGLIGGGFLGYLLGAEARDGKLWARVLSIALDVLGLPVTACSFFGALVATGNLPTGGG